ncbi:MAG: dTDP-glucose 4,6-dehydratase, partial [Candidatus Altiarchaeales archaeon]
MNSKFSISLLLVIGIVFISGCVQQPIPPKKERSTLKTEPIDLSGVETEKLGFIKYYSLSPLNITLQVSQYNLPLKTSQISNFNDFSKKFSLNSKALDLLEKNGFVVVSNPFNPKEEVITRPYKTLKDKEIPIFITSDSLLHLYHIQFDETLRQIEEREFYDRIWEISNELLKVSVEKYNRATGDLKEALKRNIAYLSVGLSLLKPREDQLCPP